MEGEIMIDLPQTRSISLKSYIEDIKKSIKDENYLSVLCISLIIPDICINYLDWDNKDGKGYKKWIDKLNQLIENESSKLDRLIDTYLDETIDVAMYDMFQKKYQVE